MTPTQKEKKVAKVATAENVSPRVIRRGDLVQLESGAVEVVRDVTVILHMANNMEVAYKTDQKVTRVPPEDLSDLGVESQAD